MRQLEWSKRAQRDADLIRDHWIERRPDYVEMFAQGALDAILFLLETPGAGSPIGSGNLRRWRIGRTPYLMLYRFTSKRLRVIRVYHERQNWRRPVV